MGHSYEQAFKLHSDRKSEEFERHRERVRALRAEGLTFKLIATRLGISETKAQKLFHTDFKWMEPRA